MTQAQLDRAIARLTGESVDFVRDFGFSEVRTPPTHRRPRKARRLSATPWRVYRHLKPQPQQPRLAA